MRAPSRPGQADVLASLTQLAAPLGSLTLGEIDLTEAGVEALEQSEALTALHTLNLELVRGEPTAAGRLAEAPFVRRLQRLRVENIVEGPFWERLLRAEPLPALHSLTMAAVHPWSRQPDFAGVMARGPVQPALPL